MNRMRSGLFASWIILSASSAGTHHNTPLRETDKAIPIRLDLRVVKVFIRKGEWTAKCLLVNPTKRPVRVYDPKQGFTITSEWSLPKGQKFDPPKVQVSIAYNSYSNLMIMPGGQLQFDVEIEFPETHPITSFGSNFFLRYDPSVAIWEFKDLGWKRPPDLALAKSNSFLVQIRNNKPVSFSPVRR